MTEITEARRELAALAAAMRGWDPEETAAACLAAKHAGWDFEQTAREVFRLLLTPDGEPADLRNMLRNAAARAGRAAPADYASAAARAREMFAHRNDPDAAA